MRAVFESFKGVDPDWSVSFDSPRSVRAARSVEEVIPLIETVEEETRKGRWAVVVLTYEAAPAFDPALIVHKATDFPLAWAAVFDSPRSTVPSDNSNQTYEASEWEPLLSKDDYAKAIASIRRYIAAGDTYQVNYTFPLRCEFEGDSWGWYRRLSAAQGAGYCAYIDMGRYQVLSLSPELFFKRAGNRVITRPMKGTMARGRWAEEDDAQRKRLAASVKDRAENLMIVDLLRNDLGKISVTGSVRATSLFDVERFRTLLQMTSTIESICKPDLGLSDVLRALFPCGSVTGAPKVRTMQVIRELEPFPRGVYTGAIGVVKPGGDSVFNVAIRTLILDGKTGEATFGVGGGITYDSTAEGEYDECVLKADFLDRRWPSFALLETVLLEGGEYFLLERHIERAKESAGYFYFQLDETAIRSAFEHVRIEHDSGRWKVRLLVKSDGSISIEAEELKAQTGIIRRVRFAPEPVNTNDPFLYHKTTKRDMYERALRDSEDCDDVIFWNERGEVTESTIANIVLETEGRLWTPPRESGLLRGAFRDELLSLGEFREAVIYKDDLRRAGEFFLINSVRKWMRAVLID